MATSRTLLLLLSGAALGAGLVIACGDDSPADVDAGPACDCPAAEAPLSTGRIEVVEYPATIPAGGSMAQPATCDEGALMLSGGCFVDLAAPAGVVLNVAGRQGTEGQIWQCQWTNSEASPVAARAQAVCLNPAE